MFKFDTHMHFDLYKDKRKVLEKIENNKSFTIAVTNLPDLFNSYQNQFDWEKFKYIRLALGFHPELTYQYNKQIEMFIALLPKTRYVGEVGLDYTTINPNYREIQREVFKRIIFECNRYKNKILTIHSRCAEQDVLKLMSDFSGTAIFHWYSGNIKSLMEAVERGYYFSINQQMLFSKNGRKIIDAIPVDKLLIESDAPFTKGLELQYDYFFMGDIYNYLEVRTGIDMDDLSLILKNNFKSALI
ncbi:MAG: TatD family hydrolase [Candidatus Coproplasma sp.]